MRDPGSTDLAGAAYFSGEADLSWAGDMGPSASELAEDQAEYVEAMERIYAQRAGALTGTEGS